jgi:hypothetical protein
MLSPEKQLILQHTFKTTTVDHHCLLERHICEKKSGHRPQLISCELQLITTRSVYILATNGTHPSIIKSQRRERSGVLILLILVQLIHLDISFCWSLEQQESVKQFKQ